MQIEFVVTRCPLLPGDVDPLYRVGSRFSTLAASLTAQQCHWVPGMRFESRGVGYRLRNTVPQTLESADGTVLMPEGQTFRIETQGDTL